MNYITLEEAQRRLGEDVVICLEPQDILEAKTRSKEEDQLWVFNPGTGRIVRGDCKFFDVRMTFCTQYG